MNPVTTALTLNMQLPNIAAVSWAVQGDQLSRQIQATLVDGSTAWNPQTGYHGVVRYHKPDGTSGVYDVDEDGNPAVTWTGNVATVKIVQQALTVAGTVLMQLEFYDANEARVTAFGWANNVQPSAVTDDEFLSSDYYNILTLQIAGVLGAAGHPPYIDSVTKDWMIWDANVNDYVDSGVYSIGPPPTPQSTTYEYANSASGTVVPSAWSETRPAPVQGQYSWTKVTTSWETGTTVYYTVAYQGVDGTGAADIKEMIAPEEESATATNSYAIGDYFILNNTLYIATAAISPGDTITVGTNCQQAAVGSELVSLKNTLNTYVRPNLLDNWYFGNPVNQRGQNSYSNSGYTVDRWKKDNKSTINIQSGSIRINFTTDSAWHFYQFISAESKNDLAGKTVTLTAIVKKSRANLPLRFSDPYTPGASASSASTTEMQLVSVTYTFTGTATTSHGFGFVTDAGGTTSDYVDIYAVKFEIGSGQTLAHNEGTEENPVWVLNEIPDYGEQLLKCQRYFYVIPKSTSGYAPICEGVTYSGTYGYAVIPAPANFYKQPTITATGNYSIRGNGTLVEVTINGLYAWGGDNVVAIGFSGANFPVNHTVTLARNNSPNAEIYISADL